jgi:pyruvate/2-oxoglutarate dehydrogenase complex dihydrolipoamide dehydrogenase (E3) component
VGASYVALECAGFLTGCGYDTTVMVRSILLRGFDQDMANMIGNVMVANGTKMVKETIPNSFEKNEAGKIVVKYTLKGEEKVEEYDTVLLAIGRYAYTDGLNLEAIGLKTEENGKFIVNEFEQTTIDHIYAIGDVIHGMLELTPVAIKTGRLLAQRLFSNSKEVMDYLTVPTTVFTPLEYGCCGYTEEEAKKKFGDSIKTFHTKFKPLEWCFNKARNRGSDAYVKVLVNKSDNNRVVGFHILAPNAGEITQGVAVAMKCGVTKEILDSTVGIHPTVAEDMINLQFTKEDNGDVSKSGC